MKKWEIEHHIKSAIETMTPDVYETAASADIVKEKKEFHEKKMRNRRNKWVYAAGAIAACFLLVIGFQMQMNNVVSVIEIDVNPSIEIQVNKDDRVIDVIPKNQDGILVLENMDLKHTDINVASNAILGSMVKKGYINDKNNAILITIKSEKEENEIALEKKLTEDVNDVLNENQLNAMVLNQKAPSDKKVEEWSKKYNISYGKAAFIYHMTEMDDSWKPNELAALTISQLMELANKSDKVALSDLVTDYSSYISETEAAALIKDSHKNADILQIKFDYKDSRPIFIVQLEEDGNIYEITMEAYTGKLLTEKSLSNEEKARKESKTKKEKDKKEVTDDEEKKNAEKKENLSDDSIEGKNENNKKEQEKEARKETVKAKDNQSVKQKEPSKEEAKKPVVKKTPTPVIVDKDDDSDDSDEDDQLDDKEEIKDENDEEAADDDDEDEEDGEAAEDDDGESRDNEESDEEDR